jgi:hypothetical protein
MDPLAIDAQRDVFGGDGSSISFDGAVDQSRQHVGSR